MQVVRGARQGGRPGFSLVELLVTLVVAGIIASVVVFRVHGTRERAAHAAMLSDLHTFTVDEESRRQQGVISDTALVTLSGRNRVVLHLADPQGYALVLRHPATTDQCWVVVAPGQDPGSRCGVPDPLPPTLANRLSAGTRVDRYVDANGRTTTRVTASIPEVIWTQSWTPARGTPDSAAAVALSWGDRTVQATRQGSVGARTLTQTFDGDVADSLVAPTPLVMGSGGAFYGLSQGAPMTLPPLPGFSVGGVTAPQGPPTCRGEDVTLAADTLTVDGQPPQQGTWTLGDGRQLDGLTVRANWPRSGSYPVTLTLQDAQGTGRLVRRTVRVAPCS